MVGRLAGSLCSRVTLASAPWPRSSSVYGSAGRMRIRSAFKTVDAVSATDLVLPVAEK